MDPFPMSLAVCFHHLSAGLPNFRHNELTQSQ